MNVTPKLLMLSGLGVLAVAFLALFARFPYGDLVFGVGFYLGIALLGAGVLAWIVKVGVQAAKD